MLLQQPMPLKYEAFLAPLHSALGQEPMSRSMQLNYIPVTAFS